MRRSGRPAAPRRTPLTQEKPTGRRPATKIRVCASRLVMGSVERCLIVLSFPVVGRQPRMDFLYSDRQMRKRERVDILLSWCRARESPRVRAVPKHADGIRVGTSLPSLPVGRTQHSFCCLAHLSFQSVGLIFSIGRLYLSRQRLKRSLTRRAYHSVVRLRLIFGPCSLIRGTCAAGGRRRSACAARENTR